MQGLGLATGLYPAALVAVNLGVGAGLYSAGALFTALLLFLCGALVLAGVVSSVRLALTQSSGRTV